MPADSGLLEDLRTVRLPRVREELKLHQQGISPKWETLAETLTQLQASVAVPVFQQRRLLGVLVLGEKRSGRIWSQDDLNLLMVLANQAALAIENAQLHEAEEQRLIKEAIEQTAADIAYGVSHQFNNRLYVISILSSMQVLSVAEKDLTKMSNEELAGWVRKLAGELKKITEEAEMGGQISKGIMSLAKAIPENFKPIEILPIIEHALDFVRIKHAKEKVEGEDLVPTVLNGVPKDLPKILGNHAQIHDSLMNLLDNALDAIREKIYRTRRGELPATEENYKGKIQVKAGVENGKLVISVQDDGIGIEKENMRRCFAPYFTTKATGVKGRGLGGHGLG
ncbi:MAG: GAF domain-containing protein, partial [Candidatus Omnitrophica bacterium]|nr:GAF domain-containing protein [Candidatus Omnitrophota bacterium]